MMMIMMMVIMMMTMMVMMMRGRVFTNSGKSLLELLGFSLQAGQNDASGNEKNLFEIFLYL